MADTKVGNVGGLFSMIIVSTTLNLLQIKLSVMVLQSLPSFNGGTRGKIGSIKRTLYQ